MIKKEAVKILENFVFNHIQAGNFWNDPAYKPEVDALNTLVNYRHGFVTKRKQNQSA